MKVKELIRRLQAADPTGEIEACVGNIDIHFVSLDPAYYDGRLQILKRDPAHAGYYDICGAEITNEGRKVQIHVLSVRDAIWDNPDLPVSGGGEQVEKWRQEVREEEVN